MSNINLLPWREEIRERQKSSFYKLMLTFVGAGVLVSVCVYLWFDYMKL